MRKEVRKEDSTSSASQLSRGTGLCSLLRILSPDSQGAGLSLNHTPGSSGPPACTHETVGLLSLRDHEGSPAPLGKEPDLHRPPPGPSE